MTVKVFGFGTLAHRVKPEADILERILGIDVLHLGVEAPELLLAKLI